MNNNTPANARFKPGDPVSIPQHGKTGTFLQYLSYKRTVSGELMAIDCLVNLDSGRSIRIGIEEIRPLEPEENQPAAGPVYEKIPLFPNQPE
jgi:hypothetical protein